VLLTRAVNERIADSPNASILANVEELKGLINTIVSNVGEDFIAQIQPKAAKLFFVSDDDKETILYREKIVSTIEAKFKSELEAKPQGMAFRKNGTWRIHRPNFARKDGRRVFWISRIEIEVEAGTVTAEDEPEGTVFPSVLGSTVGAQLITPEQQQLSLNPLTNFPHKPATVVNDWYRISGTVTSKRRVTTHKGRDVFEVLWSTEVTMSKDLKKAIIEDITHVEFNLQSVS